MIKVEENFEELKGSTNKSFAAISDELTNMRLKLNDIGMKTIEDADKLNKVNQLEEIIEELKDSTINISDQLTKTGLKTVEDAKELRNEVFGLIDKQVIQYNALELDIVKALQEKVTELDARIATGQQPSSEDAGEGVGEPQSVHPGQEQEGNMK